MAGVGIGERHVLQHHISLRGLRRGCLPVRVLVLPAMHLVDALDAELHVLPGIDEAHQLLDGHVQLPDDVLDRQHHAQRQLPVDDGRRRHDGDDDVFHLVDEQAARLLRLLKLDGSHLRAEHVGLRILPLPPLALLAVLQLDVLHAINDLHCLVLPPRIQIEELIVHRLAFPQEGAYPPRIEQTPLPRRGRTPARRSRAALRRTPGS